MGESTKTNEKQKFLSPGTRNLSVIYQQLFPKKTLHLGWRTLDDICLMKSTYMIETTNGSFLTVLNPPFQF